MTGSVIAFLGAVFVILSLTLVRYQLTSGNSQLFAIMQGIGALLLIISTFWQFNLGNLLLQLYVVIIMGHTIYLNAKKGNQSTFKRSSQANS